MEFDVIEGLKLRSLNDSKSAYACFSFEPQFFERCTTSPLIQRKKRNQSSIARDAGDEASDYEEPPPFSCRVAIKALGSVVRNRKNVVSLRVLNEEVSAKLYISFEFHVQSYGNAVVRMLHRIPVAEVESVSAVATKDGASHIHVEAKLMLQLLGPLKKTDEAALFVRPDPFLSASSFQPSVLARSLITETTASAEEYDLTFQIRERTSDMPEKINESIVLVFPLRESKAVMQYCQAQDLRVDIYFHWGSQPMIWAIEGSGHSVQLVLATMDHKQLEALDPDRSFRESQQNK